MFISYIRSIILYFVLIVVVRLMGKRQIGEMEPSEFVVAILIADSASVPICRISAFPLWPVSFYRLHPSAGTHLVIFVHAPD